MKTLMLKLEPIIWALFGAGMMTGGLLLPAFILVVGLAWPLGLVPAEALSLERVHGLVTAPIGRLVVLAAIALPVWGGAHHLRHLWIDLGGIQSDRVVGPLLYGVALVGSVLGVRAVVGL